MYKYNNHIIKNDVSFFRKISNTLSLFIKNTFRNKLLICFLIFTPIVLLVSLGMTILPLYKIISASLSINILSISFIGYGFVFFKLKNTNTFKMIKESINNNFIFYFSIYITILLVVIFSQFIFFVIYQILYSLNLFKELYYEYYPDTNHASTSLYNFEWDQIIYYIFICNILCFSISLLINSIFNNFYSFIFFVLFFVIMNVIFSDFFSSYGYNDVLPGVGYENIVNKKEFNVQQTQYFLDNNLILKFIPKSDGNYSILVYPHLEKYYNFKESRKLFSSAFDILKVINPFYYLNQLIRSDTFSERTNIEYIFNFQDGTKYIVNDISLNIFTFSDGYWTKVLISPYLYIILFILISISYENLDKKSNHYKLTFLSISIIYILFIVLIVLLNCNYDCEKYSSQLRGKTFNLNDSIYYWNTFFSGGFTDDNFENLLQIMNDNGISTHVNLFTIEDNFNKLNSLYSDGVIENVKLTQFGHDFDHIISALSESFSNLKASIILMSIFISLFIVEIINLCFILSKKIIKNK